MKAIKFRELKADEIDCRVGMCNGKGCTLLMYKDARVDMRLLDEVVGAFNWKREHEVINGNLYCTVSIYNEETKEWVSKQDVGTESNTEKEKGQASDSFKRACFNWGIGRELYTSPFVWVNLAGNEVVKNTIGKYQVQPRFTVKEIAYKGGAVSKLVIVDDKGTERYRFDDGRSTSKKPVSDSEYDDKLGAAILDIEACKDEQELRDVYFAYEAQLKGDKRFIGAVNQRKGVLGIK